MICFNGKFTEAMPETVSPLFDCCQFGFSTFETLRTYDKDQIFHLDLHLNRLWDSVQILGLRIKKFSHLKIEIEQNTKKIIFLNKSKDHDLRIKIFLCADFYWIMTTEMSDVDMDIYKQGVEIIDTIFERPFPTAKYPNLAYRYFHEKQPSNVFETIFFNSHGHLREGNISNVFGVFCGELYTPQKNILQGVTRDTVIKTAKKLGISVIEKEITKPKLKEANEIFITNTTKEVLPVKKWGDWENTDFSIAHRLRENFMRN